MSHEFPAFPKPISTLRRMPSYPPLPAKPADEQVPLSSTTLSPTIATLRAMQPAEEAAAKFEAPPASDKLSRDRLSAYYREIERICKELGCGVSQINGSPLHARYVNENDLLLLDRLRQLARTLGIGPNGKWGVPGILNFPFEKLVGRELPAGVLREINNMFNYIEQQSLAKLDMTTNKFLTDWAKVVDAQAPFDPQYPPTSAAGDLFARRLSAGADSLVAPTIDDKNVLPRWNVVEALKVNSLNYLYLPGNGAANATALADSVNVLHPKVIEFGNKFPPHQFAEFMSRLKGKWQVRDTPDSLILERRA